MSLVEATQAALSAAQHLTDADQGAVEALRVLARKVDSEDAMREAVLEYASTDDKYRPPAADNVSIPTYLKYAESLGLTPAGRSKLGEKKPEAKGGSLSVLRDQARAARKTAG